MGGPPKSGGVGKQGGAQRHGERGGISSTIRSPNTEYIHSLIHSLPDACVVPLQVTTLVTLEKPLHLHNHSDQFGNLPPPALSHVAQGLVLVMPLHEGLSIQEPLVVFLHRH